jgi:hypothetical protein
MAEIERRNGESTWQVCAWDLESNYFQVASVVVRHVRNTRSGSYALTDERDIYELGANQASRRLRKCILAVIPGDVVDRAMEQCEKTLLGQSGKPLADQIQDMVAGWEPLGVTPVMLERRLQHNLSATTPNELAALRRLWVGIRDGATSVEKEFPAEVVAAENPMKEAAKRLADKSKPAATVTPTVTADGKLFESAGNAAEM